MSNSRLKLPFLSLALNEELSRHGSLVEVAAGEQLLREGQFVKTLPIVLDGLVKVYTRFHEKELLLYYLQPEQSCIMTFQAVLQNQPSRILAIAEEPSRLLLLPARMLPTWLKEYPRLNDLFFAQYDLRYTDLIDTIGSLMVDKLDQRVFDYLARKSLLQGGQPVRISHGHIANDLGTAREVVTRVLKKLELEGRIAYGADGIEITGK